MTFTRTLLEHLSFVVISHGELVQLKLLWHFMNKNKTGLIK